jgi:tRNA threonylcarbamoyladenosine biosynthesis protein TsaB
MWSLFCDQSFDCGMVALFHDGCVVEAVCRDLKGAHGPCHDWQIFMDRHALRLGDLTFLTCGVGPGSYTGIRSAVATAKAVAFTFDLPIVPVSSLLLYAPSEDGPVSIVVDAGVGGVYLQHIAVSHDHCAVEPPERIEQSALLDHLPGSIRMVTNSAETMATLLAACGSSSAAEQRATLMASLSERAMSADIVARVAYQEHRCGGDLSALSLAPVYLRQTQAEMARANP